MCVIESKWMTSAKLPAVVVRFSNTYNTWRCGYVGIPMSHALYGRYYDSEIPGTKTHIDEFFQVHGGITYSNGNRLLNGNPFPAALNHDAWWFGFDCAHAGDTLEECTVDFVKFECERLACQLADLNDKESIFVRIIRGFWRWLTKKR